MHMGICTLAQMCMHAHTCICVCIHMDAHMCVFMHMCTNAYIMLMGELKILHQISGKLLSPADG